MGNTFEFKCARCGLTAEVSGGDDAGMAVLTTTIVCKTCHRLYDVVTRDLDVSKNPEHLPLRCPKSAKHKVNRWESGGPCPKCGNPMINEGGVVLWD